MKGRSSAAPLNKDRPLLHLPPTCALKWIHKWYLVLSTQSSLRSLIQEQALLLMALQRKRRSLRMTNTCVFMRTKQRTSNRPTSVRSEAFGATLNTLSAQIKNTQNIGHLWFQQLRTTKCQRAQQFADIKHALLEWFRQDQTNLVPPVVPSLHVNSKLHFNYHSICYNFSNNFWFTFKLSGFSSLCYSSQIKLMQNIFRCYRLLF